jgi:hypothetical protein
VLRWQPKRCAPPVPAVTRAHLSSPQPQEDRWRSAKFRRFRVATCLWPGRRYGRARVHRALGSARGREAPSCGVEKEEAEMAVAPEPRLLPAPRSKGCAFCAQPAQSQWVGGDELDEVIVPCCREHIAQARERWEELYVRFNDEVET